MVGVTKTWRVEPSGPLRGDIGVRGSKNAVTKHMVAAMLGDGPSTIRNAPEVGDVAQHRRDHVLGHRVLRPAHADIAPQRPGRFHLPRIGHADHCRRAARPIRATSGRVAEQVTVRKLA